MRIRRCPWWRWWPACGLAPVALLAIGCAGSTPEQRLVDGVARALGGREAVLAARALTIHGDGQVFILGQNRRPESPTITWRVTELVRVTDLAAGRWRQEQTLTAEFPRGDPSPEHEVTALDGAVAFDVGADGSAARQDAATARDRQAELYHSPLGIVRAALAPGARVTNRRRAGAYETVDVRVPAGATYALTVDRATWLPVQVASRTDHPNLGDVVLQASFAEYRAAGALRLPALVSTRLDGQPLAVVHVARSEVGEVTPAVAASLVAPAAVRAASTAPPPPRVTVAEVARGVWMLSGAAHHSAVIELGDHLVLIEAPLDDARALAVIACARALVPAKPLTTVVSTHHHFDHSGGLRAAVAEGLTVVAHARSRAFLESAMARPHTLAPDALARRPRPLGLVTVEREAEIGDAGRRVLLFATDSPHAETMLAAYLPAERLLIEVDEYTPPAPSDPPLRFPFTPHLWAAVRTRGLAVERVLPLHGHVVPFADLEAAARQQETAR